MSDLKLKPDFDWTKVCDLIAYGIAVGVPWVVGVLWLVDA